MSKAPKAPAPKTRSFWRRPTQSLSAPLSAPLSGARGAAFPPPPAPPMPLRLAAVLSAAALAHWSPTDARDAARWLDGWAAEQERG